MGRGIEEEGGNGEERLASHTFFRPCPLCPWTPLGAPPPSPHHSEEIAATGGASYRAKGLKPSPQFLLQPLQNFCVK